MVYGQSNRSYRAEPLASMGEDRKTSRSPSKEWRAALGESVRRVRVARNMSQEELADLIGATAGTVSEIERGVTSPSISTAWSMADILAVSLDVLMGRVPMPWADEPGVIGHGDLTPQGSGAATSPSSQPSRDPWLAIEAMQRQIDALTVRAKKASPAESQTKPTPRRRRTA